MRAFPPVKDNLIPTLNKMGYMLAQPDALNQAFIDFAAQAEAPVLDIGCAYGMATLPALEKGATVIANDLDEPTTGLHFEDVRKLLEVLHALVDQGNTVIVIEHSLEVIKTADWILDLGPDGGNGGGRIVAQGTPEDVIRVKGSYTGFYLKPYLKTRHLTKDRYG